MSMCTLSMLRGVLMWKDAWLVSVLFAEMQWMSPSYIVGIVKVA